MSKHINLYAKVGRAERKCVGTFSIDTTRGQTEAVANAVADSAQGKHLHDRIAEGVAPERVSYERELVDTAAHQVAAPTVSVKKLKGKK